MSNLKMKLSRKMPTKRDYYKKEINLLPADYNERKKRNMKIASTTLVCMLFLGLMISYNYYLEKEIVEKVQRKATIESQIKGLTETENEQGLILQLNERIEAKSQAIKSFEMISPKIIPVLNTLENNLPAGIAFSSLDKTEEQLSIEGTADSKRSVAEFLHNLKQEKIFESVAIETISKEELEKRGTERFVFSLTCKFEGEEATDDDSL